MPSRSFTGLTVDTSAPSTITVPEVGSIIRLIIRIDVVLPQPDGPTKTVSAPRGTSRVRLSTATVASPYTLVTLSKLIKSSPIPVSLPDRMVEAVVSHPIPRCLVRIDPGIARHRGVEAGQSDGGQLG